jgi:hypothetical protein
LQVDAGRRRLNSEPLEKQHGLLYVHDGWLFSLSMASYGGWLPCETKKTNERWRKRSTWSYFKKEATEYHKFDYLWLSNYATDEQLCRFRM